MRHISSVVIMLTLLSSSLAWAEKTITTDDFMVLYSNNVHGEIEPCG